MVQVCQKVVLIICWEDREREHAQVLSGDVALTAQLIDSSPFAKKYTSGCLSFYEHDLSDQDKQQIMQNFEQCLFLD